MLTYFGAIHFSWYVMILLDLDERLSIAACDNRLLQTNNSQVYTVCVV